jgi:DNA-binding response OmpR family regulator
MRILIADDDRVLRHSLRTHLDRWDYLVAECSDGQTAWEMLQAPEPPPLAIFDWNMPGVDGPTLCRRLRSVPATAAMYVILVTGNQDQKDVVLGLESGADDYIKKPFDWNELRARLRIGSRIVSLQHALAARVVDLQQALADVKRLGGLLPICAYCKRIRDDGDYWKQIEHFLEENSDAHFSHGICPECLERHLAELAG